MRRRLLVGFGILLAAFGVAASAGGAYAYFWDRSRADVIAAGVTVAGRDLGGLHAAEARARLELSVAEPLRRPLRLTLGGWSTTVQRRDLVRVDLDGMVGAAVTASRSGGLDARLLRALQGRRLAVDVPLRASVDAAAVGRIVASVSRALHRTPVSAKVVPTATRLKVVPGREGREVERAALATRLRAALLDPETPQLTVPTLPLRPKTTTAQLAKKYPSYLLLDRAHFTLRLFRHLKLARTFTVSVGMQGLETPAGLYRINDRQVDPPWHVPLSSWAGSLAGKTIPPGPGDPIKARWLGFYNGAGIHGTDETSSIGHAASHGCVRMLIPDVIALYPLVPLGTPIFVG
ncbi:MAG TPA: L,D-transpeptidase family protein [Gaiellaceae bacterium]|nr:L,D-transpeptidase family protein [Gaiellaceae bacterium]